MEKIDKLLTKAEYTNHKVSIIRDDVAIVDYLLDSNKQFILKEFEHGPEKSNTGVAMFWEPESGYKVLVVVCCYKFFPEWTDNGLISLVFKDVHVNPNGAEMIKDFIKIATHRDGELEQTMIFQIDRHVTQAINYYAGY